MPAWNSSRMRVLAVLVGLALVAPVAAGAQIPVPSFDLLPVRLKVGDTVWVTDQQGREIKGKIVDLQAASIALSTAPAPLSADTIVRIDERRPDSAKNGTLIGLGVGATLTAAALIANASQDDFDEGVGGALVFGAFYCALGAGVGALIDLAIPGPRVPVYERSAVPPPVRLTIAPAFGRSSKGIAVGIAF